ncbi:hypothetical protein A1351_22615 [Methylosinus sp. R-45379]|nr:hypothetical protein A1351_22615 [Methylosinus sp. R-45379]
MFLAPETKFAQKSLSTLDARRERRREWEEAYEEELDATIARTRLADEVTALEKRLPSIRPTPETAMFPGKVVLRAIRWGRIAFRAGEPIKMEPVGLRAIAIRYESAELMIREDSLFIEGPITLSTARLVGRLVGAVGWDMAMIGGDIAQPDSTALRRETRSYADPLEFQIRRLECEPLVAALSTKCAEAPPHEAQMILDKFCDRCRTSAMTRDVLSSMLRDDWASDSGNVGTEAWKIFRARMEMASIAIDLSIALKARHRSTATGKIDPLVDPSTPVDFWIP